MKRFVRHNNPTAFERLTDVQPVDGDAGEIPEEFPSEFQQLPYILCHSSREIRGFVTVRPIHGQKGRVKNEEPASSSFSRYSCSP